MIKGRIINCNTGERPTFVTGMIGIESEYAQFPNDKCLISDKAAPIPPVKITIRIRCHFKCCIQSGFLKVKAKPK